MVRIYRCSSKDTDFYLQGIVVCYLCRRRMLTKEVFFVRGTACVKRGVFCGGGGRRGGCVKKGESQRMSSHDPPFPATLLENLTSA